MVNRVEVLFCLAESVVLKCAFFSANVTEITTTVVEVVVLFGIRASEMLGLIERAICEKKLSM